MEPQLLKYLHLSLTVQGRVKSVAPLEGKFVLELLSGEVLTVSVSPTTWYDVLRNIGDDSRDRVARPSSEAIREALGEAQNGDNSRDHRDLLREMQIELLCYVQEKRLLSVEGVYSTGETDALFSARRVLLVHHKPSAYSWEETHWWIRHINALFEQWLDVLFESRRELTVNDFSSRYRSNLDLLGGITSDDTQECATLSRFLYGLSSSFLLTGNARALSGAHACAKFLTGTYADESHDSNLVLWRYGRRRDKNSYHTVFASENKDDYGTYALYEQIYALSGLTQYYRITQDPSVLSYITRTMASFEKWFRDREGGGWWSHIDTVTKLPDGPVLEQGGNARRKNWNSIGDHIPAYLVNLLLAIDPSPESDHPKEWSALCTIAREMLDHAVDLILKHFIDNNSNYVFERFDKSFSPDLEWGWQKNRGIVGHNLKISWNLTRCGHYYRCLAERARLAGDTKEAAEREELAEQCYKVAVDIGEKMIYGGVDRVRGGIFDAVERMPGNGLDIELAWGPTKDFWQQEQAILAYYILHGIPTEKAFEGRENKSLRSDFLELARSCATFWNAYFVDQENRRIYFRTTESGLPIVQNGYGAQAGHAIAGYHAFELSFLAHIYIRSYVDFPVSQQETFTIYFSPRCEGSMRTINVLPDFFCPGTLRLVRQRVDGLELEIPEDSNFYDGLTPFRLDVSKLHPGAIVSVEFLQVRNEVGRACLLAFSAKRSPLTQTLL